MLIPSIEEYGNDAISSILLFKQAAVLSSNHTALLSIISGIPTAISSIHTTKSHSKIVTRGIATRLVAIVYKGTREKL